MLICRNAEGLNGQRKVWNAWYSVTGIAARDITRVET